MKALVGLILLMSSTSLLAESKVLILRGRVPATYRVELDTQQGTVSTAKEAPALRVVTNNNVDYGGPRLTVQESKDTYLVSLIHP